MRKAAAAGLVVCLLGVAVVVTVVVAVTGVGIGQANQPAPCTVAPGVTLTAKTLTKAQLANAAELVTVGASIPGVGVEGEVAAVTGAVVESGLRMLANSNVAASLAYPHQGVGDNLDSLGLLQARPSQGWGTVAELMTAAYDAKVFYERLVKVPGWADVTAATVGTFVQAVQHSAFPGRYQTQVALATDLVRSAAPVTTVAADGCSTLASVTIPTSAKLTAADVARIRQAPLTVQAAIAYALAQLGKPYLWGASGPAAFDCSGLTMMAYQAAGITIPWTSQVQATAGTAVASAADIEPGDLIEPYADHSHVQMALGGGLVVEAPHTGAVVWITRLGSTAGGIRRIVPWKVS